MAFRLPGFLASVAGRRVAAGALATGVGGFGLSKTGGVSAKEVRSQADDQFRTSSLYQVPASYQGTPFVIKNNYPPPPTPDQLQSTTTSSNPIERPGPISDPKQDYPWLNIDFTTADGAKKYCEIVKEYCWEGFDWDKIAKTKKFDLWQFDPKKAPNRDWFHAPWMHYGLTGREPVNGLTFERVIPKGEFSKTQYRDVRNYAVGMYNTPGAAVFSKIWHDPSSPDFSTNAKFPSGTCVFKILATEATDEEFPNMVGAPGLGAVMSPLDYSRGYAYPKPIAKNSNLRKMDPDVSEVRLIQVDFAVTDPRAPIGWVFGTFMYDGSIKASNPWDRIIPVGMQWGNDPQAIHEGDEIKQAWINPEADEIRKRLGGIRPGWGWHGRMNGPADNFISACASCHSTAQRDRYDSTTATPDHPITTPMVPPTPTAAGVWLTDEQMMPWFRNVPSSVPVDKGNVSCDYSLQLQFGWQNYKAWLDTKSKSALDSMKRMVVTVPQAQPADMNQERHPQPPTAFVQNG